MTRVAVGRDIRTTADTLGATDSAARSATIRAAMSRLSHQPPCVPLGSDPVHMFTLIDAYRICDEELAKDEPDYDRYAEARLQIEELEIRAPARPEPDPVVLSRGLSAAISGYCFVAGLIMVFLAACMGGGPEYMIVGAGIMGLPAFLRSA